MNLGSSIKVTKGLEEAKVVVVDGETEHKLRFPAKTGTIAVDTDFVGYISKAGIGAVVASVNNTSGTTEDKFNALITQLGALANS